MTTPTVHPGWYADGAPGVLRWFDGRDWTPYTMSPGGGPVQLGGHHGGPTAAESGPSDPLHWVVPIGRRGWAIAAGYAGIVALVLWFVAPIALGMGVWALTDLSRHGGHGRGRAWFAVVVGALGTLLLLWIVAYSTRA